MRYIAAALAILLLAVTVALSQERPLGRIEMPGTGEWLKAREAQRRMMAREDAGLMPVDVACRHDPQANPALVKPQLRVAWAPNTAGTDWRLRIQGQSRTDDLMNRAYETQGFRLVKRETFRTGATEQEWACEVWHKVD